MHPLLVGGSMSLPVVESASFFPPAGLPTVWNPGIIQFRSPEDVCGAPPDASYPPSFGFSDCPLSEATAPLQDSPTFMEPTEGIATDAIDLEVVSGCPSALTDCSSVTRASENLAVIDSVSDRMNNLLSICKMQLTVSRRNSEDAEAKLRIAEEDLARIGQDWVDLEKSVEVARQLFDYDDASLESKFNTPDPDKSLTEVQESWGVLAETLSCSAFLQKQSDVVGAQPTQGSEQNPRRQSHARTRRKAKPVLQRLEKSCRDSNASNEHQGRTSRLPVLGEESLEVDDIFLDCNVANGCGDALKLQENTPNGCVIPRLSPRGPLAAYYSKLATVPPHMAQSNIEYDDQ